MRLNVRSEPVERAIRQNVAPVFLALGNVAAMTKALNDALAGAGEEPALHPNRLHTLLSDDLSRGINDSTLELIERACQLAIASDPTMSSLAKERQSELRAAAAQRRLRGVSEVASALGVPAAIARLLGGDSVIGEPPNAGSTPPPPAASLAEPDWSYQDVAVSRCVSALTRRKDARVGLVLPTGAGKTRTALRTVLTVLSSHSAPNAVAIWLTHRLNLREQAFRELQKMIAARQPETLGFDASALNDRVKFQMLSELGKTAPDPDAPPVALIVIDEAHHAAAPSYQAALEDNFTAPVLLLTATPNRPDGLPIGIDEIAYTITHKELAERGAVLRPEFLDFPVADFDWSPEAVDDLADYVVGHTRHQFNKVLVLAPRVERVKEFQAALVSRLAEEDNHPLLPADVGYIVGSGNSLGIENEDFLARFGVKARAVIVSAQLLLEGFDDPGIDTVVLTYPSSSVIRLMQAAGRAVRYSPGKRKAYVVQAKNTDLAYHFDERWLYQDIDDYLRPKLLDYDYSTLDELRSTVADVLATHNTDPQVLQRVLESLGNLVPGDTCRLFLYGLHYFGAIEDFDATAKWGALLETPETSLAVRGLFNAFCALGADLSDPSDFLAKEAKRLGINPSPRDNLSRELTGLLLSSYLAKQEMTHGDARGAVKHRPYSRATASTWLRYVTFTYRPSVPAALAAFLADCHNAAELEASYLAAPEDWSVAVKTPLPMERSEGFLLRSTPWNALQAATQDLRARLGETEPADQVGAIASFQASTRHAIEPRLLHRIEFLLTPTAWMRQVLPLNQTTNEANHG